MPDFPELGYGTVHGRFLAGVLDSEDAAEAPDVEPLGGFVTFSATAPTIRVTSASPDPATFFPQSVKVLLDDEGYLTQNGSRDISLWATDDQDGNPYDWQWHVTFSLHHNGHGVYHSPFNFELAAGQTVDLTVVAPLLTPSPGTIIIQGPQGEKGEQGEPGQGVKIAGSLPNPGPPPQPGVDDGEFWIDSNGDGWVWSAETASWINTGPVQGPAGPQGPQGIQGVQGVPGDVGPVGAQGIQGEPGVKGDKGDKGDPGAQGIQGETGAQGSQGVKGDTGDVGPQGPIGPEGPQGEQGIQGPAGVGGLKTYASMAELDAVRQSEVGILHVDNLNAAFPNLFGKNRIFEATGPADLVVNSTLHDSNAEAAPNDFLSVMYQGFRLIGASVYEETIHVYRQMQFSRPGGVSTPFVGAWKIEVVPPGGNTNNQMLIWDGPNGKWITMIAQQTAGFQASIMMRGADGTSQVRKPSDETNINHIVNIDWLNSRIKVAADISRSTQITLAADQWTVFPFDTYANMTGGTGFTGNGAQVPLAGLYLVSADLRCQDNNHGTALGWGLKAGLTGREVWTGPHSGAGGRKSIQFSYTVRVAAAYELIQFQVFPDGGDLIITSGRMTVSKIA
jgi:hypothetical protein